MTALTIAAAALLAATAVACGAEFATKDEAMAMVKKASAMIKVDLHSPDDAVAIFAMPMGPYARIDGLRVTISSWRRVSDNSIPARAKITGAYINTALATEDANAAGYDDCLMLTEDGHIAEGSAANFFMIQGRTLVTPPVTDDILVGITRAAVMRLALDFELDVIERSLRIFDELIVAVVANPSKEPLFSAKERLEMIDESIAQHRSNFRIVAFDGLLIDLVARERADCIVRGIRAVSDFEYEFQMALMNRKLRSTVETVFLMPHEKYTYISSRLIKEVASFGTAVTGMVPPVVEQHLTEKFPPR